MTSQRDETVGHPTADNEMADNEMAGDRMADDPIIAERHDEILAEDDPADGTVGDSAIDGAAADSTLDGAAADSTPSGAAGPSDELAGRDAVPDAGGADPAPLVMPPRSAPVEESITDDPAGPATDAAGSTTPGVPGAPAATSSPATSGAPAAGGPGIPAAALSEQQWPAIQAMFVDDPKGSVQRAAAAADEVVKALVASIEREQAALNTAWENDASTEDLRTALQQYRAFCGRLEGLA